MDGYRKEYVYSYYPTISIEIARGIPGVGKSSGDYGRIEADVHQSLMLGLCRRLNYHISAGLYTQQKSTYSQTLGISPAGISPIRGMIRLAESSIY